MICKFGTTAIFSVFTLSLPPLFIRLAKAEVTLRVSKSRSANKQNPEDLAKFESYIDKTFTATGPHNPIKSHLVNLITNYLNYSMNKLLNQVPVSCY